MPVRAGPEGVIVSAPAANTPVIVGVGFCQNHSEDPAGCPEPFQLMVSAIRDAARDAGRPTLVAELESISVEQGMWQYRNPGRLIADELGCPGARSILADLGVLQLTPLFDLFAAIQSGDCSIGVVTGGEAKFRELRARITGVPVSNTVQPENTPPPDVYHPTPDPFTTEAETRAGLMMPVELFAVIESALRHQQGLGIEEHRDRIAELYSQFSAIAANNPHAWSREVVPAAQIRNPGGRNSMLAFPYTKKHNSQWNVNQAVAILVCSAAKARQLGLDESHWIYPVAAVQSRHVVCLAEQQTLHSHLGTVMAGERAYQLAGISHQDIGAADLYSCFPSAVQSFAHDLRLDGVCPWTVTGSMAFAGGPYNHGALDGVARMVEVLRDKGTAERHFGLTSNLSGIFGKQAVAIFSSHAGADGYCFEDITEAVAAKDHPVPSVTGYSGDATVVGYTVCYVKDAISHGFVYVDIPGERRSGARRDGARRTVARSEDVALLERMTREEFVGRRLMILADGRFTLPG